MTNNQLIKINDYLISEIQQNEPFNMAHDVDKYRIDILTLTFINYQLLKREEKQQWVQEVKSQ